MFAHCEVRKPKCSRIHPDDDGMWTKVGPPCRSPPTGVGDGFSLLHSASGSSHVSFCVIFCAGLGFSLNFNVFLFLFSEGSTSGFADLVCRRGMSVLINIIWIKCFFPPDLTILSIIIRTFRQLLNPDVHYSSKFQPVTQSYKVKSQPGFLCYQVDERKPQVNSGRTENTAGLGTS